MDRSNLDRQATILLSNAFVIRSSRLQIRSKPKQRAKDSADQDVGTMMKGKKLTKSGKDDADEDARKMRTRRDDANDVIILYIVNLHCVNNINYEISKKYNITWYLVLILFGSINSSARQM